MTAVAADPGQWVADRLGVRLRTLASPVGLDLSDLVGLAVRRNPRRAHLLVSRVLAKHVPTDPRLVRGAGLLLGDLVRAKLGTGSRDDVSVSGPTDHVSGPAPVPSLAARGSLLRAALAGDDSAAARLAGAAQPAGDGPAQPADDGPAQPVDDGPSGPASNVTVLGYAETATALGEQVADALRAPYLHSTRRAVPGIEPVGGFEEEHSHATSHLLLPADPRLLGGPEPLVLVDDELSTGRTALNTIETLHASAPRDRYVIAALVDLRSADDRARMAEVEARIGASISVVALVAGEVLLPDGLAERAGALVAELSVEAGEVARSSVGESAGVGEAVVTRLRLRWPADVPESARHGRLPDGAAALRAAIDDASEVVATTLMAPAGMQPAGMSRAGIAPAARTAATAGSILVLGTEELLDVPQRIAAALAGRFPDAVVRSSSTTRSPVLAVDADGYAIRTALTFPAHDAPDDGPGPRFAYNVGHGAFDTVVVVVDERTSGGAADGLVAALAAVTRHVVVATLPDAAARVARAHGAPPALHGPQFGSYAPDEVAWLLTDLSDVRLEAPVEEREEAIQAGGAHYAESLPVEYQPSAAYSALFEEALADAAERVALAVGVVTERAIAARPDGLTLVSLARAGTPVGILMRRWAQRVHGIDAPHYAVSIVRGRGIDPVALRYVAAHHDPATVLFVDGWTGKGAIARELAAALDEHAVTTGVHVPADLAVLADPGHCVRLYGTRDDFLIPSACLNSTVSGLVSRTVLNREILTPDQFHGAKFYADLAPADVSRRFLDAVTARFDDVRDAVDATPPAADEAPDWRGWRAVEQVSQAHGIGDVNLVKPGVGETTRVLLRRVPWKVLVRADADPRDLVHIRHLAAERGVPVEPVPGLPYSCIGLIHPAYSAGATGSSGTSAARLPAPVPPAAWTRRLDSQEVAG